MIRLSTLIPIALLGMAGTAFGQELDSDTAADLLESGEEQASILGVQNRSGSRTTKNHNGSGGHMKSTTRSNGNRTVTRTTRANGDKIGTRTTGTSNDRGRNVSSSAGSNTTDRIGTQNTRTRTSITNGDKTLTRGTGSQTEKKASRTTTAGGSVFTDGKTTTTDRSRTQMTNEHGGSLNRSSKTTTSHDRSKSPGVQTSSRSGSNGSRSSVKTTVSRPGPSKTVTVAGTRTYYTGARYTTVRPYHGVFVFGPRPVHHVHYVGSPARGHRVETVHMPDRKLDRDNSLALGIRAGSMHSGYIGANRYGDLGLGATLRYRPEEAVGLELAIERHGQSLGGDSERTQTMTQGSLELFAFPWTRVSPYVLGGMTYTSRDIDDTVSLDGETVTVSTNAPLWGPHVGLGIEFGLSKSLALDLEARYVGYLNRDPADPSRARALTTTAGLLVHF